MLEIMKTRAVRFRLADILEERKMKQVDLATKMGTHRQTVNRLVGNVRQIDLETLERLCDALNLTPGDFFDYDPTKKASQ